MYSSISGVILIGADLEVIESLNFQPYRYSFLEAAFEKNMLFRISSVILSRPIQASYLGSFWAKLLRHIAWQASKHSLNHHGLKSAICNCAKSRVAFGRLTSDWRGLDASSDFLMLHRLSLADPDFPVFFEA